MSIDLISICITTRHRPELLLECLGSVLRQQQRPLQIIIGDNSEDDRSERLVRGLALPEGISLTYRRHQPTLDFVGNHNWTLSQASGARTMLLHDDDLLCDGGLDTLVQAASEYPDAAVVCGRVRHIQNDGRPDDVETQRLNQAQMQEARYAGRQACNALSALAQQMGPNGWLADTALLRQIGGWRSQSLVGSYTDIDVSVRLALACGERPFVYVHAFTSCVRQGPTRLSSDRSVDIGAIRFMDVLAGFPLPAECDALRATMLHRLTEISVVEAARTGERRRALGLLRSPNYRRPMFSAHTLYRLIYIACPAMARMSSRLFRGL